MLDFHMVFSSKMKERLITMAKSLGLSVSAVCRLFLSLGLQRFEQKFWAKGNCRSRWKHVSKQTKRKHVFINEEIYNRLMKLQTDCNFYSKGQIARKILGVVLIIVERRGLVFAREFFDRGIKKYSKNSYCIGGGYKQRHMSSQVVAKTVFTKNFEPIEVQFF